MALRSREGLRLGAGSGVPARGSYGPPGRPGRNGAGGGGGWDGKGGRPRRKGDWWRHWTWKKAATVAAVATGLVVIAASAGIGIAYAQTPIPNIEAAAQQQASTVYFGDGKTVVGHFGSVNRQMLNYDQIPALVRNAVVAAEDKNFWHEGGISLPGILRAAYYDVTNSGGSLQGGSTITQQLVRNYYQGVGTAQTLTRKIKEIFVAEKLAKAKPKEWILTQYLNTVYFGAGAYGIGAAAQAYFGVQPTQLTKLTPAQAAMLAAMIQSPGYYSPNPKAGAPYKGLVYRWHYVLGAMVKLGAISQQVASKQQFPAVVKDANNGWGGYRGYIMNRVRYELETVYGYTWPQIENDGLHIYTTVSQDLTRSLYAAVRHNQTLMRHNTPPTGIAPGVTPDGLPKYVRIGALLEDPSNGAILAMYSGQNYNKTKFDNALQSRNQVGSSFKPYVLATAVQQGMNVRTSHLNGYSPLWIPPDSEPMTYARFGRSAPPGAYNWYQVFNDEVSNPNRPVSVVEATAMSLNTSYTDLWHRVAYHDGEHSVVNMAKAFGVDTQASGLWDMRDQAGTALGQASLTVAEQAGMIATLADNGVWHTQHMIAKIVQGNTVIPAKVRSQEVLTPAQAADVDYAMSFDTSPMGTAAGLGLTNNQTIIAKTGTTNLAQSAFFLGATQKDAMAVGMFVNNPKCPHRLAQLCHSQAALSYAPPKGLETLFGVGGYAGYGGQWPTQIWHTFFMKKFNSLPPMAWPPVNNDGSAWNLVGKLPRHHHKPKPKGRPGPGCHGHGHGRKCQATPPPRTTPTPTPPPSATPTPTSTCPPGTFCRTASPNPTRTRPGGAGAGGAGGPLALAVIAAAVPALPFATSRLRGRRHRRRPGR